MDRQANNTLGLCLGIFGVGAIVGLALGLIAGILMAPRTGRESREVVRGRVDRAVNRGRAYVERMRARNGDGSEEAAE